VLVILLTFFAAATAKRTHVCDTSAKITSFTDLSNKTMVASFAFTEDAFTELTSSDKIMTQLLFCISNLQILSGLPVLPFIKKVSAGEIPSGVICAVAIQIQGSDNIPLIIVGTDINTLGDDLENLYKKVRMMTGINTNLPENVDLSLFENVVLANAFSTPKSQ
jgi:hypothetical protein